MAGRASVELKGRELGYDLSDDADRVGKVVAKVKDLESRGWTFEAADASFELLLIGKAGFNRRFDVESWRTIVEQDASGFVSSEATVKVHADGERIISTAEGNGPVNALDNALRGAVGQLYPSVQDMELVDYKVRILDGGKGTGAVTRVLVGTSDGAGEWSTVGVHENVIAASWMALEDAITYGLLRSAKSVDS
jgi:2-isopropylmalate synthase